MERLSQTQAAQAENIDPWEIRRMLLIGLGCV